MPQPFTAASRRATRARALLATMAALLLPAVQAGAQQGTLRITGVSPQNVTVTTLNSSFGTTNVYNYLGGTATYASSPYTATLANPVGGTPTAISILCVDVMNAAALNTNYTVNITSLAGSPTLTNTRWVNGSQQNATALTNADALTRYRMAAFLEASSHGVSTSEYDDIQLAVWSIMTPFTISTTTNWTSLAGIWRQRALDAAASNFASVNFANAMVLTTPAVGMTAVADGQRYHTPIQEYVTGAQIVPEPGTYVLLGTGLLALGGFARRRRTA